MGGTGESFSVHLRNSSCRGKRQALQASRSEGGQAVAQVCTGLCSRSPGISAFPVEAIPFLLAHGDCMPHLMTHGSLRTPSRHVNKAAAMTRPPPGVPPSSHVTPGADGKHLCSAPPGLQGREGSCLQLGASLCLMDQPLDHLLINMSQRNHTAVSYQRRHVWLVRAQRTLMSLSSAF